MRLLRHSWRVIFCYKAAIAFVLIFNDELRLRARLLDRPPTPRTRLVRHLHALPQYLLLETARLALELEHGGQHALQHADTVEHFFRRAALRGGACAGAVQRRCERRGRSGEGVVRDEVEEARGEYTEESGDILWCFVQRAADCLHRKAIIR